MFSKSFIKILILALVILHSAFAFSELQFNPDSIKQRIILIGDAGDPSNEFEEPVLIALQREASNFADSTIIVSLGDNIYPNGLPDEDDPNRKEYERRIDEQIQVVIDSESEGIFIPGNHDWKQGNSDSWEQIRRQADYVTNKNYSQISFAPMDGCPGPVVIDYGQYIRFIVLDSQWWLQDKDERPEPEDSLCDFSTEDQIVFALDSVLNISMDKFVIIAAHHPLNTNGPHGGCFSWKDHIFPLRELNKYLWIPLPLIGSIYPLARSVGISDQDMSNSEYENMRDKIEEVVSEYSGLIYASGHEHALQILKGENNNTYVVSGAGIWGHTTESLCECDDTIFSSRCEGFVTIDFLSDGRKRLSVIKVVNQNGDSVVVFSMLLKQ